MTEFPKNKRVIFLIEGFFAEAKVVGQSHRELLCVGVRVHETADLSGEGHELPDPVVFDTRQVAGYVIPPCGGSQNGVRHVFAG